MEYGQIWTRRQDVGGIAGSARIRFGFPGKFWECSARLILCGPFVGGAYIYIDPTPSKNETETRTTRSRGGMVRMRRSRMAGRAGMGGRHGGLGMSAGGRAVAWAPAGGGVMTRPGPGRGNARTLRNRNKPAFRRCIGTPCQLLAFA